jgi:hypothetical protein
MSTDRQKLTFLSFTAIIFDKNMQPYYFFLGFEAVSRNLKASLPSQLSSVALVEAEFSLRSKLAQLNLGVAGDCKTCVPRFE